MKNKTETKMPDTKKLSFSVRIDRVTPAHTYISVFSNMVCTEYDHENVTRAKCGELTFSNEEFPSWLTHVNPHIVTFMDIPVENDFVEYVGKI